MAEDMGEAPMPRLFYPIFLDLSDRPVLVVGGGAVAERKVCTLVLHGARPQVVAPAVTARIEELAGAGDLSWEARAYARGDCAGALLVFAATDDRDVNRLVADEARSCGCLLNVADDPDACDALVPSSFTRGTLQVAVSTGGASPTLARRIREEQQRSYGPEYGEYVTLLGAVRRLACARIDEVGTRRDVIARSCDGSLLERIRAGEVLDCERVFSELVSDVRAMQERNNRNESGKDER